MEFVGWTFDGGRYEGGMGCLHRQFGPRCGQHYEQSLNICRPFEDKWPIPSISQQQRGVELILIV